MKPIFTHKDRIWTETNCQQQEEEIIAELEQLHDVEVLLVDAYRNDLHSPEKTLISDNFFLEPTPHVCIAPEFWHIYACEPISEGAMSKRFNCMLNRISGERLELAYELFRRGLFDQGHISINCLYHDIDPSVEQRKNNFDQCRRDCDIIGSEEIHEKLRELVPITIEPNDPDAMALDSIVTLVTESYVSDTVIAFSEKIFRALQTARPWVLFCSPGSVKVLRDIGFDVLDDVVDHSYDSIADQMDRMRAVVNQVEKIYEIDLERWTRAAEHNSEFLHSQQERWPQLLEYLRQSIGE